MLTGPRALAVADEPIDGPGPGEVLVRTWYSGVSAGTELAQYRGTSPFLHRSWDAARRLFTEPDGDPYPVRTLGYEEVGELVAAGPGVDLPVGAVVFGTWGHRTHAVLPAERARTGLLPAGADPLTGVFSHIGAVALNGAHDAGVRLGDLAVVFGLGVPGQIVAQALRASGATVVGVDPVPRRRSVALGLGADVVLDPAATAVAEEVRALTGGRGADVCVEVSGATTALAEAVRTVAYASRVVAMGFYQGEARGLMLGEEFHHNRVELVCSQISGVAPAASHRWDKPRLWRAAVELQHAGRLALLPLITHRVPFADAPGLFARLDAGEPDLLQAVLTFDGAP
ncbi:MAG TPA: zinc-binding dehydrogenase [Pseudonocardiaceae bacterium]